METIQFRRGPKAEYDALPDRDKDKNDFYIVGGNGEPLTMYIGDEMVQDVIEEGIIVTSDFGSYASGVFIRPGTPVTEVLKNMLCKEMFPTFKVPTASISAHSEVPSGYEFVNKFVTIPKISLSIASGLFVSEWPQPTPSYTSTNAILAESALKGFVGYSTVTGNVYFSDIYANINSQSVRIIPGTNSVTISGSYKYVSPTNNPVSNLLNECPGCKWQNGIAYADPKTISCTGVYRIYSNAAVENPDGDGEQAVTTTNQPTVNVSLTGKYDTWTTNNTFVLKLGFSPMVASNPQSCRVIDLPENVKIESQYGYGLAVYDVNASFNYNTQVIHDNIRYNRFVYGNETIGANTFQITCKVYDKNQYVQ